jgi:hypothetical protein
MNKIIKTASIIAGFVLVLGVMAVLLQNVAYRSGVSATYPLGGRTITVPLADWNAFSGQLESLLGKLAKDSRYSTQAASVQQLLNQIKPI